MQRVLGKVTILLVSDVDDDVEDPGPLRESWSTHVGVSGGLSPHQAFVHVVRDVASAHPPRFNGWVAPQLEEISGLRMIWAFLGAALLKFWLTALRTGDHEPLELPPDSEEGSARVDDPANWMTYYMSGACLAYFTKQNARLRQVFWDCWLAENRLAVEGARGSSIGPEPSSEAGRYVVEIFGLSPALPPFRRDGLHFFRDDPDWNL
jgi:hypothetical protein